MVSSPQLQNWGNTVGGVYVATYQVLKDWRVKNKNQMEDKRLGSAEIHLKITRLPDVTDPEIMVRAQPSMVEDDE